MMSLTLEMRCFSVDLALALSLSGLMKTDAYSEPCVAMMKTMCGAAETPVVASVSWEGRLVS
jgi:hypothetical protein